MYFSLCGEITKLKQTWQIIFSKTAYVLCKRVFGFWYQYALFKPTLVLQTEVCRSCSPWHQKDKKRPFLIKLKNHAHVG